MIYNSTNGNKIQPQVNADSVPAELKTIHKWGHWRRDHDRNGEPTKIPITATGVPIDHAKWDWSFVEALELLTAKMGGLGLSLPPGVVGIDIDHCVIDGVVDPWAVEIIEKLDTYTEISPSGTGVRMFALGSVDHAGVGLKRYKKTIDKERAIEIYPGDSTHRFLTVTGNCIRPVPVAERSRQLNELFAATFAAEILEAKEAATRITEKSVGDYSETLDVEDSEIIEMACGHNQKFKALWAGDISAYKGDDSAADAGLVPLIAYYTGPNAERIKRIMRA